MDKQEQRKCQLHGLPDPDFETELQVLGTWLEASENHHLEKLETLRMLEPKTTYSKND